MTIVNIGIVAHVDVGKTMLTERILFETKVITKIGRVDHGNTQTDSLELEKRRGITIKASVVSFFIQERTGNLIDTAGHADFIAEIERTFSVLDREVSGEKIAYVRLFSGTIQVRAEVTVRRKIYGNETVMQRYKVKKLHGFRMGKSVQCGEMGAGEFCKLWGLPDKRTVEKHIANILTKLAVPNRAQLVRWAVDHSLTQDPL